MKVVNVSQLAKKIQSNNRQFEDADKANKRMMIACDVLRMIRNQSLYPEQGTYITAFFGEFDLLKTVSSKTCQACALGSMFVSFVLRRKCEGVRFIYYPQEYCSCIGGETVVQHLSKYFSKRQLILIESAFECGDVVVINTPASAECQLTIKNLPKKKDVQKAISFGCDYPNDFARLEAIMKNIIQNKGTFKP